MLELVFPCTVCGGSGSKTAADKRVAECECRKRKIAAMRLLDARIPERYQHCVIRNYQPLEGPYEKSRAAARLAAGMFVENAAKNTRDGYGLLLIGAPGVGKTHLAVSIVNELLTSAKHLRCLFPDFRELLADIRYSFNSEASVTEASLLEPGFRGGFAHYR